MKHLNYTSNTQLFLLPYCHKFIWNYKLQLEEQVSTDVSITMQAVLQMSAGVP